MNLVYDNWRVSAITHREKILTDFQKKYKKYKTFIPDLKTTPLTRQQEILKPFFRDYDSLRPDEGTFKSVDDFLSRPFYYLSIYEKIRTYELLKKEFPYAWLKHYNTWEKRENAYFRMQNALYGITIVDNLSSIAGFDFFSGASLKNYERIPSDIAYLNIQNALISSKITLAITKIKSCLMTGMPIAQKKLSFPLRETLLFSQLEQICRSNFEFSMKETLFSHIKLSDLIYVDGVSLMKKCPACKESELQKILYNDLISEEHQVHVAVSQYVPLSNRYKVRLMLLELTDILEDPNNKNLAPAKLNQIVQSVEKKNLTDNLSGQDKMAVEFELAKKMELARNDYEVFYQKHFNYEGQNEFRQRMEIFCKNIFPEPYFLTMGEFFQKSSDEFHTMLEPYGHYASVGELEKLYLFYVNEYGKLNVSECQKAINALLLGKASQYLPVLEKLIQDINSVPIEDYAFFTPSELFENLNRYFPLYHKTLLADKLIRIFPDFSAVLQKDVCTGAKMNERFRFCRTFYDYACKLSNAFGFSFDNAKSLPHGTEIPHDSIIEDEVFVYFQNWLTGKIHSISSYTASLESAGDAANPSVSAGYSLPICLSELDLPRLLEIINAKISWLDMENMPNLYFDGKPIKSLETTESISNGRHILDIPCFYPDSDGEYHVIFLRIYERTGVLPTDAARKKHTTESALKTGKKLAHEMNQTVKEYIDKLSESVTAKREVVEKSHEKCLTDLKNDVEMSAKIKEQIEQEQKNLLQKKEELKKLRTLPPPEKPSSGKKLLNHMGMFKKAFEDYQNELAKRRENLIQAEQKVTESKKNILLYKQQLEISHRAEEILKIHKEGG